VRALSELFVTLAAIATIAAATVRIWFSKPRQTTTKNEEYEYPVYDIGVQDPKAPSWLRTLAKWWLYVLAIGATVGVIVIAIVFVIRIIDISH
jgi:hypothetical protein